MNSLSYLLRSLMGLDVPAQKKCKICKTIIPLNGEHLDTYKCSVKTIGFDETGVQIETKEDVNYRIVQCPNCLNEIKLYSLQK